MSDPTPHGCWPSAISAETLARSTTLEDVSFFGDELLWIERREGRSQLVASGSERPLRDITPDHDVRGGVGYGGAAFSVGTDDHGNPTQVFFVHRGEQLLSVDPAGDMARQLAPIFGQFAGPVLSPRADRLLYVHHYAGHDCLAVCEVGDSRWPIKLVQGADFYMQPTWHPSGNQLAWVEWDHPNMPWQSARLCLGTLRLAVGGQIMECERRVIGDSPAQAVFQPLFSPDGKTLFFAADGSGYYELYCHDLETSRTRKLTEIEADIAQPAWVQGMRTLAVCASGARVYAVLARGGFDELIAIDPHSGQHERQAGLERFGSLGQLAAHPKEPARLALIASGPTVAPRIVEWQDGRVIEHRIASPRVTSSALSAPRAVEFPTGPEARFAGGSSAPDSEPTCHGLYYPPASFEIARDGADTSSTTSDGLPPALILVHGGPTAHWDASFRLRTQFFATRGYAVLELNYRGSSGYGRAYRDALDGNWGIVDVEDAVAARAFLIDNKLADPRRVGIMGGSAGGYTVLAALVRHPGVFAAGVSLYGISNLLALARQTHKFESRYLDTLIGPLPAAARRYHDRSPLFHAERIRDALALFQGADDRAVPPNQAEEIVAALTRAGTPHVYRLYPAEGHGFRKPETLREHYHDLERFLLAHLVYR